MAASGMIEKWGVIKRIYARIYCKMWSCPYCGPRKAWLYQQLIAQKAQEHGLDRFMTLTLDPKKIKGDPYKHLNKSWGKLRTALRRKLGKSITYIAITEEHKSGVPHKHILVDHFIHQGWLSNKWSSLGGGPMVDIRKIKDLKNMVRYVGKYLTKDILISAPKGTRRITTSQNIKLREKLKQGVWSITDRKLETLFDIQKRNAENIITNKDGRLNSFEINTPLDLTHFEVPNDRPLIEEGDREKFPEIPDYWVLIAKYEKKEHQNETSSHVCQGFEQRAAAGWIFNSRSIEALGGILPGTWLRSRSGFPRRRNRKARGPAVLRGNAGVLAQIGGMQNYLGGENGSPVPEHS